MNERIENTYTQCGNVKSKRIENTYTQCGRIANPTEQVTNPTEQEQLLYNDNSIQSIIRIYHSNILTFYHLSFFD